MHCLSKAYEKWKNATHVSNEWPKVHNQDPSLELTELEANLIAKNIVFMKIFQLPKTRWTALKDKIINVPINDDSILNTVNMLPRTPTEAGLIEVDLKRKYEY